MERSGENRLRRRVPRQRGAADRGDPCGVGAAGSGAVQPLPAAVYSGRAGERGAARVLSHFLGTAPAAPSAPQSPAAPWRLPSADRRAATSRRRRISPAPEQLSSATGQFPARRRFWRRQPGRRVRQWRLRRLSRRWKPRRLRRRTPVTQLRKGAAICCCAFCVNSYGVCGMETHYH